MENTNIYLLLLMIITGMVLSNCDDQSPGSEPMDKISGYVADSLTNEPIDSAQILFGDTLTSVRFTYTNTNGFYTIYPSKTGVVDVFCRKSEYITEMKTIELFSNNLVLNNYNFKLIKK